MDIEVRWMQIIYKPLDSSCYQRCLFSANIDKERLFNFNHLIFTISYDYENITDLDEKQPLKMFCKKGVLINFAEFTGKYLCQSLFFNKVLEIA